MVEKREVIQWNQQEQECEAVTKVDNQESNGRVLESEVRSYCRVFKTRFHKAKNEFLYAVDGTEYLDFFAGA
ncbi:MAG: hypothetical protein KDA77_17010, partial [Planctomycetaceae bacterium]|nr:hypothetical protein [Planctomycetaceae bacterium]